MPRLLAGLLLLLTSSLPAAEVRPNILWLIAEDFSPDLGCYGAKHVSTPNLDRLASQGVRYTRAFTTAPVCSASRSAFITGMYQTTIGAHHHRSHRDDGFKLPPGVRVIPDWMRDAGYFTANVRQLPAACGFNGTGKTDWNFSYDRRSTVESRSPDRDSGRTEGLPKIDGDLRSDVRRGQETRAEQLPFDSDKWDDLKSHQPFYAQVNFNETHRVNSRVTGRPWNSPEHADPDLIDVPPIYPDHPVTRRDWAGYLDAATALDRKVGAILKQLEADSLAENTVVIFMADHGQAHVRGKQFCYDDGLRIPLIVRWPEKLPRPKQIQPGSVSDQLLVSLDITATSLAIAGVPKPAKMQGRVFLGDAAEPPRSFVFGARDRCDETTFRFRTVRDARYRYIRNFMPERPFFQPNEYKQTQYPVWNLIQELGKEGKLTEWQRNFYLSPTMPAEELYDLDADPWAMQNLVASNQPDDQAALRRLRGELERWLIESDDQGRFPEPPDVAAAKGATKRGSDPKSGAAPKSAPAKKAKGAGSKSSAEAAPAATGRPVGFQAAEKRPNVLFILCDDIRWDCLSCAGHPHLKTPHIDALAGEGVRFANAFCTTSLCSPSRASILSGLYAHSHRVLNNFTEYPNDLPSFPRRLHDSGYATAYLGKWHMGEENDEKRPGFDYFVTHKGQGKYFDTEFNIDGRRQVVPGYYTHVVTKMALDWLAQPREKPFLLMLGHKAPHSFYVPEPKYAESFADVTVDYPDTAFKLEGKPAWFKDRLYTWHGIYGPLFDFRKKFPDDRPEAVADFAAMTRAYWATIRSVDDSVGQLVAALRASGQLDNTLVVFMGDNGLLNGEHGMVDKRTMHEPSIRVPLVVRFPMSAGVPAGRVVDQIVLTVDVAPSILDVCDAPPLANVHGRSFVRLAQGDATGWRRSFLYSYNYEKQFPYTPNVRGVRTDDWKYIRYPHGDGSPDRHLAELYHLRSDPEERRNLIGQPGCAAVVCELEAELIRLLCETGAVPDAMPIDAGIRHELPDLKIR